MENALKGQRIIVFGATGRVGGDVCRVIAAQGATVGIHCSRSREKALSLAEEIRHAGGRAVLLQGDASVAEEVRLCVKKMQQECGGIDGVVDLIHKDKSFVPARIADMEWNDFDPHIEAMKAYFNICKAVIPVMRKNHYGRIVFLSGGLSCRFMEGCAPFSAVKAALNAFSKTLALEEGKNGITVNIVAPGKIRTEQKNAGSQWEELERRQMEHIPLCRFALPVDIGNAIVSLLLPENGYITGQTLFLAGGEIMPMP